MARIPWVHAARGPILMGLTGGFVAPRCAPKTPHCALKISRRGTAPLFATRRTTSLQTQPRQPLMGRGRGREDMETHGVATRRGMGDGRGNLRENREDPAPTVGRSEDAIAIQMLSHYRRHARTVHPACRPPREPLRFLQRRGMGREGTRVARHLPYQERNSQSRKLIEMRFPAVTSQKRRIATVSERLNCVIETSLPVRNAPYKRLTPYGPLAADPFGIRRFKPDSPGSRRT